MNKKPSHRWLQLISMIKEVWFYIWFQDKDTVPLEVMRVGLGGLMFFNCGFYSPEEVLIFYADSGLIALSTIPETTSLLNLSLLSFLTKDWQVLIFHYCFVMACLLFAIGWQTRWIKWLVLLGHLSFLNRNEFAFYGVDTVLMALLFILCMAPIGSALSMDRYFKLRSTNVSHSMDNRPLPTSMRGFACQRLLQFQMVIIYMSAGYEKLFGNMWHAGDAPWYVLVNYNTAFFPVGLFAEHYWLVYCMAYGTIIIEMIYAFLIWDNRTRPYMLAAALFLHLCIAVMLGIVYFAAVMAVGHLVFMRRRWYRQIGRWFRAKTMTYATHPD